MISPQDVDGLEQRIKELTHERDELSEQLKTSRRDYEVMNKFREDAEAERDAMAAHVERQRETLQWIWDKVNLGGWAHERVKTALADTPDTSLARLKAKCQVEALERLRELLQATQMDQAPTVSRAAMHVNDAINRVAQECGVVTIRSQAEGGEV